MVTEPAQQRAQGLFLLITPWEFGHRSASAHHTEPFRHAPFYKNEKGVKELKDALQGLPGSQEESPVCIFASPYYSFVPEDLYEEGDQKRMLDLAFSEDLEEADLRTERSQVTDTRIVHWYPRILRDALTEAYPGFVPLHFTVPAIETLLGVHVRTGKACGLAHIRHGEVDVGFAAQGGLRLFNSFSYATAEELVYFTLHTWRTCGAGEELEQFHITGTTEQGSEKELLQRYIEEPVLHEDGEGSWRSFLLEEISEFADHKR
ncbi:MAG: DUF3822 family protein [Flavobacteriales bacterium]